MQADNTSSKQVDKPVAAQQQLVPAAYEVAKRRKKKPSQPLDVILSQGLLFILSLPKN
jgi:hypothetical protein